MMASEKAMNSTDKNLRFAANRYDGFGARMTALLNAMYCSKKFNVPFAFYWRVREFYMDREVNSEKNLLGIYFGTAEEIFSPDFIASFHDSNMPNARMAYYRQLKGLSFAELLYSAPRIENNIYAPPGRLDTFFSHVDTEDYEQTVKECWKEIKFSDRFNNIIKYIDELEKEIGECICIHIRSGDIVYKIFDQFTPSYKALPSEFALQLIVDNIKQYNILLLGDDLGSLIKIENAAKELIGADVTHKIYLSANLVKEEFSSEIDLVFFDMYLMSKAKVLYSSGYSALSKIIELTSNSVSQSCYAYFSDIEQYECIKKYIDVLQLHPYQQAFSSLHLFYLAQKLKYSLELQLKWLHNAVKLCPENFAYKILYMWMLLQNNMKKELDTFVSERSVTDIDAVLSHLLQNGVLWGVDCHNITVRVNLINAPALMEYLLNPETSCHNYLYIKEKIENYKNSVNAGN